MTTPVDGGSSPAGRNRLAFWIFQKRFAPLSIARAKWDNPLGEWRDAKDAALREADELIAGPLGDLFDIQHDDLCRLSRVFTGTSDLRTGQDIRINEWLKGLLAATGGQP